MYLSMKDMRIISARSKEYETNTLVFLRSNPVAARGRAYIIYLWVIIK